MTDDVLNLLRQLADAPPLDAAGIDECRRAADFLANDTRLIDDAVPLIDWLNDHRPG